MKKTSLILSFLFLALAHAWAGPILNIDRLGEQLGGWESKGERAADYERSGSKYRTWKPEVTAMLDGGLFISMRIDHMRGLFASDDHASLQVSIDKDGNVTQAQSSMVFQGQKITSDAIRLGGEASTSMVGVATVAKIGTDLLADLSSKLLQENVAEPGRVTFPAVIHHNYNLLCLSTGLLNEAQATTPAPEEKGKEHSQKALKFNTNSDTESQTGQTTPLSVGS